MMEDVKPSGRSLKEAAGSSPAREGGDRERRSDEARRAGTVCRAAGAQLPIGRMSHALTGAAIT
jgi:hypothetical protein